MIAKREKNQARRRWVWLGIATAVTIVAVVAILALVLRGQDTGWPTERWATSTPEEQGMDPAKLEAMMAYVDEHDMAVDSIVIVRHGHVVFEAYGDGHGPDKIHRIFSVTKSVTSMLIGIALDAGLIEGVDAPLTELLPDDAGANLDARWERMTLEHLLTMTDGMDWNESDYPYDDARNSVNQMWFSADALQFVLERPMARDPGQAWAYNSGAALLLGGILEEATGRNPLAYARETLFDPLGIGFVLWERASGGHFQTDGGLSMTSRDMARLGHLMLHNGTWDGQQIVSADWVARSTTAHSLAHGYQGYGYLWWILPEGQGYKATGLNEQHIYVLPEADMVVVTTASIPSESLFRVDGLLNSFILPACTDLAVEVGREIYDEYGFTFEYPKGFILSDEPIPGRDSLSDASGMMQVAANAEPVEIVSVLWDEAGEGEEVGALLQAYLTGLAQTGVEVTAGESGEGRKDGHPLAL